MDDRETVIKFLRTLPENMSLTEIARELECLTDIHTARKQAKRDEGVPAIEGRKLIDSWISM